MRREDLVPGKEYFIKYSGEFCHIVGTDNVTILGGSNIIDLPSESWIFLNFIKEGVYANRAIFIKSVDSETKYLMMGADEGEELDYIEVELNAKIVTLENQIKALQEQLNKLKR